MNTDRVGRVGRVSLVRSWRFPRMSHGRGPGCPSVTAPVRMSTRCYVRMPSILPTFVTFGFGLSASPYFGRVD
jgi:hypothetical protein